MTTENVYEKFESFPSIKRLYREMVVTEKLDGTNAQICIDEQGAIRAGSRNRWITPEDDNFGFARWVAGNSAELMKLGVGRHYGEWWGSGIQRGYGLNEKRFSLFNVSRWGEGGKDVANLPSCCHVVPVLYRGPFDGDNIDEVVLGLENGGSVAVPGANAEGIVIFHTHSGTLFKWTFGGDGHKSEGRK
jgi:hypothetical protein